MDTQTPDGCVGGGGGGGKSVIWVRAFIVAAALVALAFAAGSQAYATR